MEALYFSYVSLLTIGYGDYTPHSNAGKAFFVLWSLLAVPSLTILISNMGDTIVKWFSDFTMTLGTVTVLPEEKGFRASLRHVLETITGWSRDSFENLTLPGVLGAAPLQHDKRMSSSDYHNLMLDRLAGRLSRHVANDPHPPQHVNLEDDMRFYNYVLARECRDLQKDLHKSPPKQYKWGEWEYFLKLMGNEDDSEDFPGQQKPDIMVPAALRAPKKSAPHAQKDIDGASDHRSGEDIRNSSNAALLSEKGSQESSGEAPQEAASHGVENQLDGNVDRQTSLLHKAHPKHHRRRPHPDHAEPAYLRDWSWLSNESPLMSTKSEAEWILERLSAALERELNRQRMGHHRKPPITLKDAYRQPSKGEGGDKVEEKQELGRAAQEAE